MPRWLSALALAAVVAAPVTAQLTPEKGLAALKVADGLQVELFAAEPMVINPTAIDVDHKGRVWVAEAVNYRRTNFRRPILREEGDRIQVLVDKDGDGKADESVTFYQGKDLYGPLSVCVSPYADGKGQKVFVAQSPDILVFEDADGDLKADGPPKKFLSGAGGFDHDHGVHGLIIGPDGKLYFTIGDTGVKNFQSTDGKGPKWNTNSTDCRAGTVWKCNLDGTSLELIAHNFRNNYEATVNSFGEVWLSDNDDDGNQQTRICFVMPGGNYGYHPRGPGQTHWHEEQPGIVHKTLRTGFGSPTGICFYEGTLLPEKYRGQLFHCDAGPRELRAFLRTPKGAGYELEKENILTSTDNWFRLSDVCVGPDGSLFASDWYDPGVGGHGMGDWKMGRVYRITPVGHKGYTVPEVKFDTKEGIHAALRSPCLATRAMAIDRLKNREKDAAADIALIQARDQNGDEILKARAIALQGATPAEKLWIAKAMEDPAVSTAMPATIKAEVVRKIAALTRDGTRGPIRFNPTMFKEWTVMPAAIRRELLLLIPTMETEHAKNLFYALARKYDGQDIFYRAAINIATGNDPKRRDEMLADFDTRFPMWDDKTADLVWELRPKSVLPRLETLLADAKLTAPQKARVIDILAANDDASAGKTLLGVLATDAAPEVKARALENIRLFLPTKWKALAGDDALKTAITKLLGEPKTRITGLQLASAANYTAALGDVTKIVEDKDAELATRLEAVRTLGGFKDIKAVETLINAGHPQNELTLEIIKALGNQLPTTPKPTDANKRALEALQMALGLESAKPETKLAALTALAGNRAGTVWLLEQHGKKELPGAIVADAGKLVRNTPFADLRAKALLAFPASAKLDPKKLPANAILAQRNGNVENGKRIFNASITGETQCLKCHMVRGIGGQIGPDLSMVGKKASKENLFESILQPSKAIADQSVSWKIDTADGQTITGLLVAENETSLTLRDANGKDYTIAVKDIDKKAKSLVSLMPDNLAVALTEDELVDMVAYLATLQTAAITPDSWLMAGPFPADDMAAALGKDIGPEKAPFDIKAKFPANGKGEVTWRNVRAGGNGYYDLQALHGTAAPNSATYAYRTVESPEDQEATILLGTDDGAKLWVNGTEAFKHTETRAAAVGQDSVKVKLKKGTNTVLLKVANGDGSHGFFLTILSGQELKLAK